MEEAAQEAAQDVPGWLSRGTVTTCDPVTGKKQDIEVVDFVQANYKDGREVSYMTLEDGTIAVSIENPPGSGRNEQQVMRLSPESLIGLLATAVVYYSARGIDMGAEIMKATVGGADKIHYSFSDNLTPSENWNEIKPTV